jgi:hypothetical protein
MLIIDIMKNLDLVLEGIVGKSVKSGFSVNSVLFEILKGGKKLSREELKMEMLKFRLKEKFGDLEKVDFNDKVIKEDVIKLSVTSRNSIDTIISKNNSSYIFKDIAGFEKHKVVLESGKYFLNVVK